MSLLKSSTGSHYMSHVAMIRINYLSLILVKYRQVLEVTSVDINEI